MLRFASIPQNVLEVEQYVASIVDQYQIDPCKQGDILISLTEAVNNAIIHGNDLNAEKMVSISMNCCGDSIAFRISDEGPGFNPANVPNPLAPENLESCGGRGVFLMQQLADDVSYTDNGSTVEMSFHL